MKRFTRAGDPSPQRVSADHWAALYRTLEEVKAFVEEIDGLPSCEPALYDMVQRANTMAAEQLAGNAGDEVEEQVARQVRHIFYRQPCIANLTMTDRKEDRRPFAHNPRYDWKALTIAVNRAVDFLPNGRGPA